MFKKHYLNYLKNFYKYIDFCFWIIPVNSQGHCVTDSFSIAAPGAIGTPIICGTNTGYHSKCLLKRACKFKLASGNFFLAASTECSAGSNDHFVVGVGAVPSLVQFDERPLGGANFQY
jgi:hypothetical protein